MNFDYDPRETARHQAFQAVLQDEEFERKGHVLQGEHQQPAVRDALRSELMARLGEAGYLGAQVPEADGGAGSPALTALPLHQALARANPSLFVAAEASITVAALLARAGSPEQKARLLPGLLSGTCLATPAFTNPLGILDPTEPAVCAFPRANGWELSGATGQVVCARVADPVLVLASVKAPDHQPAPGLFLASRAALLAPGADPRETPGLQGAALDDLDWGGLVPPDARLGASADVPALLRRAVLESCLRYAAFSLGVSRELLERSLEYTGQVEVRGKALYKNQEYSFKVAEMYTLLDTGEQLCRHAAWQYDRAGAAAATSVLAAKLFTSEASGRIAHLATQIRGANGYRTGPQERLVRDVRYAEFAILGSEAIRAQIAGDVLKTAS
jgi:butyryl-CoA dehydrogenase